MKKCLIIGNGNSIVYKEVFCLIKNNQLWLGYLPMGSETYFHLTDVAKEKIVKEKKEGSGWANIDGEIFGRVTQVVWFTNLDNDKRHKELDLYKTYNPTYYPKYDNYDAIEVSKTKDIPYDYDGVMGVPISFLNKYNPNQFELVGCSYEYGDCGKHLMGTIWGTLLNGNVTYKRLFIRRKNISYNH